MTCPLCHTDSDPALSIDGVSICGACGGTCATDADGTVRVATAVDVTALDLSDLQRLRRARGGIVRPKI